jgi:hypothetical protein
MKSFIPTRTQAKIKGMNTSIENVFRLISQLLITSHVERSDLLPSHSNTQIKNGLHRARSMTVYKALQVVNVKQSIEISVEKVRAIVKSCNRRNALGSSALKIQ